METTVFKGSPTRLRIADVLLTEEEGDGGGLSLLMEGCTGIVSRWLSRFRRGKVSRVLVRGGGREEEEDIAQNTRCSTNVLNGRDLSSAVTQNDQSGVHRCGRECSINMGVGCSLLYLVAASKNELDKMKELRTQMEILLQNFKEEMQGRNTPLKPSKSDIRYVYPAADAPERVESTYQHSPGNLSTSYVLPESTTTIAICEKSLKCETPNEEELLEGIDQLQAELETELERLQLHLDNPQQQGMEVTVEDTSSRSYSFSSGEVINPVMEPQDACAEVHYGVHPYELERRLHEVLEARQQEHIRELEAALECTRLKLREKEIEISWWKDTTKLIAQHIAGPSRHITERV